MRSLERAVGALKPLQVVEYSRERDFRACVLSGLWSPYIRALVTSAYATTLNASTASTTSTTSTSSTTLPVELLSTDVTVSLVEKKTQLPKLDVVRLLSTVEGTGFNAAGQMYRKTSPQALDYGDVKAVLEYFEGIRGVRTQRLVRNSPFVLGLPRSVLGTFDENKKNVEDMLDLRDAELGKIVSSNAYILTRHSGATARPCVEYLMGDLGLSKEEVRSIVLRFPRILLLSSSKIEDVRVVLGEMMGIDSDGDGDKEGEFARMLYKFPPLAGLSASKLKGARDWLVTRGVVRQEQLRSVVTKFPQFLSHDLEAKLEPIVAYMTEELRLPEDVIARALMTAPDVFGRSLDTIRRNVEGLRGIGLTDIDLGRYLRAFPGGLKIDVSKEPYRSKLEFLEGKLGQKPSATLPVHPMFLTYGLARIVARGRFLQEKGRSTNGVTAWLSAGDAVFAERFARSSLPEFSAFKGGVVL